MRGGSQRGNPIRAVLVGLGTALGLTVILFLWPSRDDDQTGVELSGAGQWGPGGPGGPEERGPLHGDRGRTNGDHALQIRPVSKSDSPDPTWLGERLLEPEQDRMDDVEEHLVHHLRSGDRKELGRAHHEARALVREYPDLVYGHLLLAYILRLQGDGEGELDALDALQPWGQATYHYFFERSNEEVLDHLLCNRMMSCLIRESRRGQPLPASSVFDFFDAPLETGPITCGDQVLHPATCPDSYAVYERVAWTSYSRDRAELWSRRQPETISMPDFLDLIGVEPGLNVADVGAGQGYFTWALAEAVGEAGEVHAVEIDERFLHFIEALAREQELPQVETVLVEPGDIGLERESVDLAFVCDVFQDLFNEDQAAKEADRGAEGVAGPFIEGIARALTPGGTMVVVDHEKRYGRERESCVSADLITTLASAEGLEKTAQYAVFEPVNFVAIYRKPAP